MISLNVCKKLLATLAGFSFIVCVSCSQNQTVDIVSPDGKISVSLTTRGGQDGRSLMYDVLFNEKPIIEQSPLGILLNNDVALSEDFHIVDVRKDSFDETYTMPHGKSSRIRNYYNEAAVSLRNGDGTSLDVIFRAYNDGAAFRYRFPEQESLKTLEITGEVSSFKFTGDHRYWGLHLDSYTTAYEMEYTIATLSSIGPESLIGLPLLIEVADDAWIGLTEANLTDYAGMYVKSDPVNETLLRTSLSLLPDSTGVCVRSSAPRMTPWRVLMIGDDPGRLVESNIILNLNDPCAIDDSWVKPGTAINDWTSDHTVKGTGFKGAMDTRTIKHYIDFCADYNLDYMSIDAGWAGKDYMDTTVDLTRPIPEIDMPGLVSYAKERGVDVFVWTLAAVVKRQMDEAFAQLEKWGIKGVNVDFNNRDDQETVNFVHRAIKTAAKHKLHIEFHGIYKPTGIRRTYPNLLTREGVLGLEFAKWDRKPTPDHNCIIPFTRMLAGPLDYIPVGFTNATRENYEIIWAEFMTLGTRCHSLAHLVIFESGFQVLADYPDNYRGKTGDDFFRHVPAAWDETKVLLAKVGEYITISRKRGDEWFMGSNTNWKPRELEIILDFLDEGDYVAEIYSDGSNAATDANDASFSRVLVKADDIFTIKMAPGGGQVARFYPAPEGTDLPRYSQE